MRTMKTMKKEIRRITAGVMAALMFVPSNLTGSVYGVTRSGTASRVEAWSWSENAEKETPVRSEDGTWELYLPELSEKQDAYTKKEMEALLPVSVDAVISGTETEKAASGSNAPEDNGENGDGSLRVIRLDWDMTSYSYTGGGYFGKAV